MQAIKARQETASPFVCEVSITEALFLIPFSNFFRHTCLAVARPLNIHYYTTSTYAVATNEAPLFTITASSRTYFGRGIGLFQFVRFAVSAGIGVMHQHGIQPLRLGNKGQYSEEKNQTRTMLDEFEKNRLNQQKPPSGFPTLRKIFL